MKLVILNSFNPTFWDDVINLGYAEVIHICPVREDIGDITLSQEVFKKRQEAQLLEWSFKYKLDENDIILVVDHTIFDFKHWQEKLPCKFVGLVQSINSNKIKKKFKYKIYQYHFPDLTQVNLFYGQRHRTLPLIEIPEPLYENKQDQIAVLYTSEHDPERWRYIEFLIEERPKYKYVFLNPYTDDINIFYHELSKTKMVINFSKGWVPNYQYYINAFGYGCMVIGPMTEQIRHHIASKWTFSASLIGLYQAKIQKFWMSPIGQTKLRNKLLMWVDGLMNGYCFRQYEARKEYDKMKYKLYLSPEEFINKLKCL